MLLVVSDLLKGVESLRKSGEKEWLLSLNNIGLVLSEAHQRYESQLQDPLSWLGKSSLSEGEKVN